MTELSTDQPYGEMDLDFAARASELSPEEDGPKAQGEVGDGAVADRYDILIRPHDQ